MTDRPAATPPTLVPLRVRIGWGFGGLADNYIINAMNALGMVIYVTHFKMDPTLVGIAMFIPRFIDAIADPLIGNLSDNTRTRWGRRRPYMVWGAGLSAMLLPLIWMPPMRETVLAPWHANYPFIYFSVMGTLYALAYSLFVVPYTALGFELTNDYDERTRVLAWRMYIGLGASMTVPWLYKLCLLDIFPNEGVGAVWVSVGLGVLIVGFGLIPVLVCREREDIQKQETIRVLPAIKYTFTNMPFMILSVAYVVIIVGLFSAGNLYSFVNIYYVFDGSKKASSDLGGMIGTVQSITSYVSMFLIMALSVRWSKRFAMNIGLAFALVGVLATWFALDPRWPYLQVLTIGVISSMGLQGCWLMISSMIADICDEDELKTGFRREGMFGAVNAFSLKIALAITSLAGGVLLKLSGFDQTGADTVGITLDTAINMKTMIIGLQAAGFVLALGLFAFYPISRERAEQTRRLLDARRRAEPVAPKAERSPA